MRKDIHGYATAPAFTKCEVKRAKRRACKQVMNYLAANGLFKMDPNPDGRSYTISITVGAELAPNVGVVTTEEFVAARLN